jgi:diacylglycerol kinase family enzyme
VTEAFAEPDNEGVLSAVVINPSKVDDLEERRAQICSALGEAGWPTPLWLETTPDDPGCGQTREAVEKGARVVFACGGDGTVMACVSELAGTDVALAVLPAGTGNLLATNLGLPDDAAAGVRLATEGARRRIDVGAVEDKQFAVMAGMGFDAKMLDSASEALKKKVGWPAYVLSALRHLRDRPMRLRIRFDGGTPMRRRAVSVIVGNVGKLQGGVALFPEARPDDGKLDVALISARTLRDWAAMAWGVVRRRPHVPALEMFRAERIELVSAKPQARELDGDVVEPSRSMTIEVRKQALVLCVPHANDDPAVTSAAEVPAG